MCIRQASMFNDLRSRLIAHGFTNIEYNIINMVKGIDKLHALEAVSPNISVHQETHEDKAVETLGAGKDHFLILDSCNRLVYQVIMPWSFLFYPYVKAAILSAYNDKPCGDCDGRMIEEGYTTVTIIKHIPLLDIFKMTFPEQKEGKKHSQLKKHGHHHHIHSHSHPHHHHHIHSHPHPHSHHHHHHHHHSYPVYYNFEENNGNKMTVEEQYHALKSFLSNHLHLLNINNDTFEVHSQGNENDYKKFYNTESGFVNTTTEHNTQSDIFGNTVVYTDELTKVPLGTDAIRVEQIEGNVGDGSHTISKDEVLSQNSPPLQVTLWYPHYHVYNGQRLKDHYFIVLHSKDPKYHGHIVPDAEEEKEVGDSLAGEKEHQIGHTTNISHQSHEQSYTHDAASGTDVGVQTDDSHSTGTIFIQKQDNAYGVNAIGGTESERKTGYDSAHMGQHSTHTIGQHISSGGQNAFGQSYSYNKSYTETSETHNQSTSGTQHGHNENEIVADSKKTGFHGKDISGTTAGEGHETGLGHGSSLETSVLTVPGHTSSQGGHRETVDHTSHGYSTETYSTDKNTDLHHESDKKVTQGHFAMDVSKTIQHKETDTAAHHGKDAQVTETEAHTEHGTSVTSQEHGHLTVEDTSSLGIAEGTSIHAGNTGFLSSGFQNQIGGNQYGTNSQSESSAHGGKTHSESSSYSTSYGSHSYSSSSSSSSGGGYPSTFHNTITGDNHNKTVSQEQSGSSQTNIDELSSQADHTSGSYGSGGLHNHVTDSNVIQNSGSHSTDIHDKLSSTAKVQKTDIHSTQTQSSSSHVSGSSGSDSSSGLSSSSSSQSTGYATGGDSTSSHSTQTHVSGSDNTSKHTAGGQSISGYDGGSHSTSHITGSSATYDHNSSSHGTQTHVSGSDNTYKHTVGGESISGQYIGSHDKQNHVSGSGGTSKHTPSGQSISDHGSGSHSTGHIITTSTIYGHNKESQDNYNSNSHGSSTNSTYSHTTSGQTQDTGSHATESEKTSSTGGHISGSLDTSGQSSYSLHGKHETGSSMHQIGTTTQGQILETIQGGSTASQSKGEHSGRDFDDRIIFRDNSREEFDFKKYLEKQEKEYRAKERQAKTHLRTMEEGDAEPEPEPIEKTKDGEELINHYSKILPWIEYPVD